MSVNLIARKIYRGDGVRVVSDSPVIHGFPLAKMTPAFMTAVQTYPATSMAAHQQLSVMGILKGKTLNRRG